MTIDTNRNLNRLEVNKMRGFKQWFGTFSSLEKAVIFTFLIPPVGMLWLFYIGWRALYDALQTRSIRWPSYSTALFTLLIVIVLGSSIEMEMPLIVVVVPLIAAYWGLYLEVIKTPFHQFFQKLRWIVVSGAVYSYAIGTVAVYVKFPKIIGYLTGTILFMKENFKGYDRISGAFYNPNFNVYIMLFALAIVLVELIKVIRKRNWRFGALMVVLTAVLTAGVIATESRTGYGAMVVLYMLFLFRLYKPLFLGASLTMLLATDWIFSLMPRSSLVEDSLGVRTEIWTNAYQIWSDHWLFGMTPVGFGQAYQAHTGEFVPHAHNLLISFFTEYGLIGGLAMVTVCSFMLFKMLYLAFTCDTKKTHLDYFLLVFPVVGLTGMLDNPTFSPQIGLLTIVFVASWFHYSRSIRVMPAIVSTVTRAFAERQERSKMMKDI
ncbi:MAG: O-antigen ligase family protein [Bacilli bacterium]